MKKTHLLLLIGVLPLVASCGGTNPGSSDEEIDPTKTQLHVSNFNGAYGDEWLKSLEAKFEKKYAGESFEPGKTGVQVIIDNSKTTGNNLLSSIPGSANHVYFCESVFYFDYLNAGVMADITDVVTGDLAPYGDKGTIADKMTSQQRDYYQADDGKYYGLPHYSGFYGLTYDLKLWREKKLYIAADPTKEGKVNALYDGNQIALCRQESQKKSNGPDGMPGTYDDGFPATYKEMADLMEIMVKKGITPFTWAGKYQQEYNAKLLGALLADYEGPEQTQILFDYAGTAKNLVKEIDAGGKLVLEGPTTIANENAYRTFESAGRYYALKFMENIVNPKKDNGKKYYSDRAFSGTEDHLAAQQTYLLSYPEEAITNEVIAILPEGNYWENEANNSGTFDYAATMYGEEYSRANRELAMMPLPKATEEKVGEKTTLLNFLNSLCFINSNCDQVHLDLAKKFLMMANTHDSLVEFNLLTNAPKALAYTLTDEQYQSMNRFGQSVYDLRTNGVVVDEISTNQIYANNVLDLHSGTFVSEVGGSTFNNPVKEMCPKYTPNPKTAEELFLGLRRHFSEEFWNKNYSKYF